MIPVSTKKTNEEPYGDGGYMHTMELDESNGLPLYRQLKDILLGKITTGEWSVDSQIPTEEELVATYKVSRSTVRSAIAELTRQGLLYRKRGVGTFVVGVNMTTYSIYTRERAEDSEDDHINLGVHSLLPDAELAHLLQIAPDVPIFKFLRLRIVGEAGDLALEKSYIKQSFCPDLLDNPPRGRFYDWLEKRYDIYFHDWETSMDATIINKEDGDLVRADAGTPALLYKRLYYDAQNVPMFFSTTLFRGDRFCMSSSAAEKIWIIKPKP